MTDDNLRSFAARVRPFFEADLRDTAEALALEIAQHVGIYAKLLRPETTLAEVLAWLRAEELALEISGAMASRPAIATFRDLVELRAQEHCAA